MDVAGHERAQEGLAVAMPRAEVAIRGKDAIVVRPQDLQRLLLRRWLTAVAVVLVPHVEPSVDPLRGVHRANP
jgi:hypothetical protein